MFVRRDKVDWMDERQRRMEMKEKNKKGNSWEHAITRVSLSGDRGLKTITGKLNRLWRHSVAISGSESSVTVTGGEVGLKRLSRSSAHVIKN
jgi:hypothetical protein